MENFTTNFTDVMGEFIDHRRVIVKCLHHNQTLTRKNDQS